VSPTDAAQGVAARVKAKTPRIQDGCSSRRARIWAKEMPLKVYQRKKALTSRPGTVFEEVAAARCGHAVTAFGVEAFREAVKARGTEKGITAFHCIVAELNNLNGDLLQARYLKLRKKRNSIVE